MAAAQKGGAVASKAAAAEPAPAEGAFQKLRRATVALKSAAEARGAVVAVKGGPEAPEKKGPSAKELEEAQKTEMRRAAALERKKLREERERLKAQGGGGDDVGDARGGGGGGGDASAAELEALRVQLEQEVERRAAAEAALEKLKEKQDADRVTARELKQLAKDYRAKFEESSKENEELKAELEEQRNREAEQQERYEAELSAARTHAAAAGGGGDELVDDLQDEINMLNESLAKAKAEARTTAKETRELKAAIETLEKDMAKLMEENDLLLGEVAQAEEMQEAVEGILALGDPAELVQQLEELLVENEALTEEVAALKKKVGGGRR